MMANLNPSILSALFPRYYQERMPDVGKALQSVMSGEFKGNAERAKALGQTAEQNVTKNPGKFDPATGKKSYTAAKERLAELTEEQKAVYEDMKKGFVSADDPRLKFLDKLSEQDLKKAGIERTTDESGKAGYKASAVDPEEVKRRMEMGEQGGKIKPGYEESGMSEATIRNYIRQEAIKRNIDPDAAVRVATTEGMGQYQSGVVSRNGQRERSYGPYQLYMDGGLGNMFKKDTGIDPEQDRSARSIQMQIQYALDHAAKQGNWDAWHGVRDNGLPRTMGMSKDTRAIGTSEPTVGTALTEEQAINQIHAQRRGALAGSISEADKREQQEAQAKAKTQNDPTATPTEKKVTGTVYTAGDSIGVGVGQANKIPSVAKGGWSFTDKRTIDQLYNVPEGSTVQLYAGTNDATNQRLDPRLYEKRMAELKQIAEERGLKVSIHGPHQSPNQSWSENVGPVNEMMANAARNNGIKYVDNTAIQADARDNIHMSSGGYKRLYERSLQETTVEQEGQAIPTPAMADGGETQVNEGEIRALPIGAMKSDNSVVVDKDNNPLFTMDTKKESANYDPNTGKVSVDKNGKDPEQSELSNTLENKSTVQQSVAQIPESSSSSSFDSMLNISDELFKDPSFHRSMARARFGSTADPALGGQFAASGTVS